MNLMLKSATQKFMKIAVTAVTCFVSLIPCTTVLSQSQFLPTNFPPNVSVDALPIVSRQNNLVSFRANGVVAFWDPVGGVVVLPNTLPGFPSLQPSAILPDGSGLLGNLITANNTFSSPFFW